MGMSNALNHSVRPCGVVGGVDICGQDVITVAWHPNSPFGCIGGQNGLGVEVVEFGKW